MKNDKRKDKNVVIVKEFNNIESIRDVFKYRNRINLFKVTEYNSKKYNKNRGIRNEFE